MSDNKKEFKENTKLQNQIKKLHLDNSHNKNNTIGFIKRKPTPPTNLSVRIRTVDRKRLDRVYDEVNAESQDRVFTKTDIIRGLIYLAEQKLDTKKIIFYIKNSY